MFFQYTEVYKNISNKYWNFIDTTDFNQENVMYYSRITI